MSYNQFNGQQNFQQGIPQPQNIPQQQVDPQKFTTYVFKCIMIGDGGVGKTTFATRIKEGYFIKNYVATVGAVVYEISFYTNKGHHIIFKLWDTAGQEVNSVLSDVYYVESHCAIIMFDVTSRVTYKNIPKWSMRLQTLTTVNNVHIPTVILGNKIDCKDRKVKASALKSTMLQGITSYFDISAKGNYNFEKPFITLAKQLLQCDDLEFVANFDLNPAEIAIGAEELAESRDTMLTIQAAKDANIGDDDFL